MVITTAEYTFIFKTFRRLSFSINLLYMSINNIYKLEFFRLQ